jgi:hypothetical protein
MVRAVTLLVASGGGDSGNGTTADFRDAILPWYTDIVIVRSNKDDNHTPANEVGNIDRGVINFDNHGMWCTCGGQQQRRQEGDNTGSGSWKGGGMAIATKQTTMRMTMHRNYINTASCITCQFICISCHAVEATQRHANP